MAADLNILGKELQDAFLELSASHAADHLISPHIPGRLLNDATAEQGTPMWIVNRSDVYDLTLQKLFDHPLPEISGRAREKYSSRHTSLQFLSPPEEVGPLEQVPDHDVEEVLGHPLASFEAMLYFSKSINEDHRATSALSLTRRLVEHPPNWSLNLDLKHHITENFYRMLREDPSVFARAYAARVPLYNEGQLSEALQHEKDELILGRILQNPASESKTLKTFLDRNLESLPEMPFAFAVCFLDARIDEEQIRFFLKKDLTRLQRAILSYQEQLKKI